MLGSLSPARSTPIWAAVLLLSLLLLGLTTPAAGLRSTAGSPCVDACNQRSNSTTGSEIACLDDEFQHTEKGSKFQNCVECQLRSNYSDSTSGQTDVEWGLCKFSRFPSPTHLLFQTRSFQAKASSNARRSRTDNLRYAFTSCVFGFPESVNNISSQCTVSCQSLDTALEYDLKNPSGDNVDTWCGVSSFADNIISQCEFCYNLTTTQVYMANCKYPSSIFSSSWKSLCLIGKNPQSSKPCATTATSASPQEVNFPSTHLAYSANPCCPNPPSTFSIRTTDTA